MARPGYLSLYADEKTQRIFDEFVTIKGITKSYALSEMLEIYMLSQDESLFMDLKKKALNIDVCKRLINSKENIEAINDFIFIKLSFSSSINGEDLSPDDTVQAYIRNIKNNGLGYTWFSTQSLFFGMAKGKVEYYNSVIKHGGIVRMLFALSGGYNDIAYSANVEEIVSNKEAINCPGDIAAVPIEYGANEEAKIWIKLSNIRAETEIKASMLKISSSGLNLKQVITTSQYHFGYVCLE